jgi:predicted dehydrogenase
MRLGLIGSTGHWQTDAPAIEHVAELTLVAVAPAGPEETTGAFDHAPVLTMDTCRHDDAQKMLETERLDVVQVCVRGDRIPHWARICLERGLPVLAEMPLAMDLPTLEGLFQLARKKKLALVPMHAMRGDPMPAAMRRAVRGGEIGEPLLSFSQKTYKWGKDRSDAFRSRMTFAGIAPWVGIHAFDWLHAILGDLFTSVRGCEGATARPDHPACASQAAFVLSMKNGGVAALALDFLHPESARTATSGCRSPGPTASSRPRSSTGR